VTVPPGSRLSSNGLAYHAGVLSLDGDRTLASTRPVRTALLSQRIATGPGGPPAVPTKGSGDAQRSIS
jgi:hypothetical protein